MVTGTGAYALVVSSQKACEVENNIPLISSIENIVRHRVLYVVCLSLVLLGRIPKCLSSGNAPDILPERYE